MGICGGGARDKIGGSMQKIAALDISERKVPSMVGATSSPLARRTISKDGATIAFDRRGQGFPLILVDGALCYRGVGESGRLAALLAPHFTVFTYDRRGRGDSGDAAPYAVEREVEDIAALLNEAGGEAFVWGISSGAVLALEAAKSLAGIKKLALYEAPFIVDDSRPATQDDWVRIGEAVAAGRRSEAIRLFLKSVGAPGLFVTAMRLTPMWSKLKAVARTLPYDGAIVRNNQQGKPLPADRWLNVTAPTLVIDGGASPVWMQRANRALADLLPNAQYRTLKGQTHRLQPKALAPILATFFKD
jgi:pimeloyl-ACP methyl ester carboxylesterase